MPTYRLRLRLKGPFATPFSSGTIFGHLCWAHLRQHGEARLIQWLGELPHAPWSISDAFPADHLPRPALRPPPPPPTGATVKDLVAAKAATKCAWVRVEKWQTLRVGLRAEALQSAAVSPPFATPTRLAHNTIDRRTSHTPETAGLWFADECWPKPGTTMDVYVSAPAEAGFIRVLFEDVGREGFGRDANFGRGQFGVQGIESADGLMRPLITGGAQWRMSLSHGVLTPNMKTPRYRLFPHFGKLGRVPVAGGARPWKLPLLLTRPGAVFQPGDEGPFGAWITGVHQDRPEVGHNGFHLAIPFTLAERPS